MIAILPETTMGELLSAIPGARRALFRRYHIGGCSSCGFAESETLAEVCARNENLPPEEVIAYLQAAAEEDEKVWIDPEKLAGFDGKILDIRTAEEFEAARIPGSILFSQETMQEALGVWDRTQPVVIVDHTGSRALDAAAYLSGHGFTSVRALRGGVDQYSERVDSSIPRYTLEFA